MKATPKPCAKCPFLKTALKGWLGPWESPQALLGPVLGEAGFVCHMTMQTGYDKPIDEGKHRLCAGSLICANKSVKRYRDADLQREADKFGRETEADVLSAREFVDHHTLEKIRERRRGR